VTRLGAVVLGVVTVLSACTHYNTLYNAERVYRDAERDRLAGRDSLALLQYRDVASKTSDAYRSRPGDARAAAILYLLGRAQLRAGEPRAAALALEEAARRATEPGLRPQVLVYLAAAQARLGDAAGALALLDEALEQDVGGEALAEARLLRGSLELARRPADSGWSDLASAGTEPGVRLEAGLERLRLSIQHGERERARVALSELLAERAAGERLDSVVALLESAAAKWGPRDAAGIFSAADSSRWEQPHRGRARLVYARLLQAAADTAGARQRATDVASGRGEAAAEARLLLASWRLGPARDLGTVGSVRALLLPASTDQGVDSVLRALDELERLAGMGLDEPLGWFAAAEVARDRLGAPILARGFFLAYADIDPASAWAPKALLGALDVSPDEPDRDWLRQRLEAHVGSPYVLAARGHPPAGLDALEEELSVRLQEITGR
jgi:tetratricopeptide (TPR) repeat protein